MEQLSLDRQIDPSTNTISTNARSLALAGSGDDSHSSAGLKQLELSASTDPKYCNTRLSAFSRLLTETGQAGDGPSLSQNPDAFEWRGSDRGQSALNDRDQVGNYYCGAHNISGCSVQSAACYLTRSNAVIGGDIAL